MLYATRNINLPTLAWRSLFTQAAFSAAHTLYFVATKDKYEGFSNKVGLFIATTYVPSIKYLTEHTEPPMRYFISDHYLLGFFIFCIFMIYFKINMDTLKNTYMEENMKIIKYTSNTYDLSKFLLFISFLSAYVWIFDFLPPRGSGRLSFLANKIDVNPWWSLRCSFFLSLCYFGLISWLVHRSLEKRRKLDSNASG